jgi:formate dehydrogenase subunit delta
MTMHAAPLLKKANQIAQFFKAQPDRRQAAADMATHLTNTWPARQRQGLQAAVRELTPAQEALDPLVLEALAVLAERAARQPA